MKLLLPLLMFTLLANYSFSQLQPVYHYDTVALKVNTGFTPYKTASIRAKMAWSDTQGQQDFIANIRMVKDSLVWMSLSAMGMEGARIMVTPDSFKLISKLSSEYIARHFSYIETWLHFPVSFRAFQQLFTGEPMDIGANAARTIASEDSLPVIYFETNQLQEKIKVDSLSYTILKILLKDKLLKQEMAITFDGYKTEEGKPFSFNRSILVTRDSANMKLDMEVTRLRWNEELSFPFEVSDKYKRIE